MHFNVLLLAVLMMAIIVATQTRAEMQQSAESNEVETDAETDLDAEEESGDNALVSIRTMIADKLANSAKWSLDETEKAECCVAAFNLCERPPNVTQAAFSKTAKKIYLPKAKKECAVIKTQSMKTINQICNYYSGNSMNCAYTPNTEADFQRYIDNMPACCEKASAFCKFKGAYDFFVAKKACMGYAARTEEDLCDMSASKECQVD